MSDPSLYKGNSIFRNQPHFSFFNEPLENSLDPFFLQINEIDAHFLTEEQLNDDTGFRQNLLVDPRTKKELEELEYDHSDHGKKYKVFNRDGIKSALNKLQHKVCLRVLLAWQGRTKVEEEDLFVWRKLESRIKLERIQMQQFVREYAEIHKDKVFEPAKRLDSYYKSWYRKKTEALLKKYDKNLSFNTHTGLPHVSVCQSGNNDNFAIVDCQLLARTGCQRIFNEQNVLDFPNLNFRLPNYAETFIENLTNSENPNFLAEIEKELENLKEEALGKVVLPFESILFLLTAGDYIDLPTEVMLEIREKDRALIFDQPLPSRNCGWHTHQQVVEQCFVVFLSAKGRAQWKTSKNENCDKKFNLIEEIHAIHDGVERFEPILFDKYMEKYQLSNTSQESSIKNNLALLKWKLQNEDSSKGFEVFTTLSLPPAANEKTDKFLAFEGIKLEYKTQFGCEIMTKFELLRAWLQMRLMSFGTITDYGLCYHLSVDKLDMHLEERVTLDGLEEALKQNYHVDVGQLLANLGEFLRLLFNMPTGKYLLRYNVKYKEKFLLCAPSQEVTQNTVFLHSLLQAEPTNLSFLNQENFLPISENLCSAMHTRLNILPCAFLPKLHHQNDLQTAVAKLNERKKFLLKTTFNNKKSDKNKKQITKKMARKGKSRRTRTKKTIDQTGKDNDNDGDDNDDLWKF